MAPGGYEEAGQGHFLTPRPVVAHLEREREREREREKEREPKYTFVSHTERLLASSHRGGRGGGLLRKASCVRELGECVV